MRDDKVVAFENPADGIIADQLTEFIRENAKKMLKEAIGAEVDEFIQALSDQKLPDGRQRVVKNGYLPERAIQTGIGPVEVSIPRVSDRGNNSDDHKHEFISNLIPKYMRRTASLDVMLPLLYLKGISVGDMPSVMAPDKTLNDKD